MASYDISIENVRILEVSKNLITLLETETFQLGSDLIRRFRSMFMIKVSLKDISELFRI